MKSAGLSEETIRSTSYTLRHLTTNTNIQNPEEVKAYIANLKIHNSSKQKMINCYKYYVQTHGLQWTPPTCKWDRKIPLITTTQNIYKIISASSKKYATIFTILEETGLEGKELENTTRNHIARAYILLQLLPIIKTTIRNFRHQFPNSNTVLKAISNKIKITRPTPNHTSIIQDLKSARVALIKKSPNRKEQTLLFHDPYDDGVREVVEQPLPP
jgi:integrase